MILITVLKLFKIFRESAPIEYLEEDAAYFETQSSTPNNGIPIETSASNPEPETHQWDEFEDFDLGTDENINNINVTNDQPKQFLCDKCVQIDTELQKSQMTIKKLQKRCAEKTAEIKRLRVSEKRAKMAKKTLEELLSEIKDKKWISDEGQNILNVN